MSWPTDQVRALPLDAFDLRLSHYRLQGDDATHQAMVASLRRFGQLSPVVVWLQDDDVVLIDGFKRHHAAGVAPNIDHLTARPIEADETTAKAAMYRLNCLAKQMRELEEAWIVHALVREDGLSQLEAAQLLGRHKSWACRRLALLEKLSDEVKQELQLGLLGATAARQLTRLPAGNQAETLAASRKDDLSAAELRQMVNLLIAAKTRIQAEHVLEKPRQAIRQAAGEIVRGHDPRLSTAGNRASRQLGMALERLARMQAWLEHDSRALLGSGDWEALMPSIVRLAEQASEVSQLASELIAERKPASASSSDGESNIKHADPNPSSSCEPT